MRLGYYLLLVVFSALFTISPARFQADGSHMRDLRRIVNR